MYIYIYMLCIYYRYILHIIYLNKYQRVTNMFNVLVKYMLKKHIIYLKVQIFLFFSEPLSM